MQSLNFTNHFLIAMPNLADQNFYQTVTYVWAHNSEGAMGAVVNRPLPFSLGAILSQLNLEPADQSLNDLTIYQGGPVQQDRGFIIHQPVSEWESTIKVSEDVGVATSRDILEAISRGTGPRHVLIALGYAGWGAGQLEQEIAENAWLSSPADSRILFETPAELRWRSAATLVGVDLQRMSPEAGHA